MSYDEHEDCDRRIAKLEDENRKLQIKKCLFCGQPYFRKKKNSRFCGMKCYRSWYRKQHSEVVYITCHFCGKDFIRVHSQQKYCNKECYLSHCSEKSKKSVEKSLVDGSGGAYLKLRFTIFRRDGFACRYCGRDANDGAKLHIDHIDPKKTGGNLAIDNLITACSECNKGKGDVLLTKREKTKVIKLQGGN